MSLRLIRIGFALVLGLLLCELALGGLHLVFGVDGRGGDHAGAEVLCLGDSHTFGWNVDAQSAWPARLEGMLAVDGLDWRVANRGAPGKNTETLLGELEQYLAMDQPRLVLILAGLNNPWSRPHGEGQQSWLAGTRTARLTKVLLQRVNGGGRIMEAQEGQTAGHLEERQVDGGRTTVTVVNREGDLESFDIGGGTIAEDERQEAHDWIRNDLVVLAERVRAAGATPVLLTYALETGDYLPSVNFSIREAAVEGEIDLIDVAALFKGEIEDLGESRLFFPDAHPKREGYSAVARAVHDQLVALGHVEGQPLGDAFGELRESEAPMPEIVVRTGEAGLELDVSYEPALDYSLLLARGPAAEAADEESLDWFGLRVDLARDSVFAASALDERLRGSFGADGDLVHLSDELLGELGAGTGPLYAVLVGRTLNWTVLAASQPVKLR